MQVLLLLSMMHPQRLALSLVFMWTDRGILQCTHLLHDSRFTLSQSCCVIYCLLTVSVPSFKSVSECLNSCDLGNPAWFSAEQASNLLADRHTRRLNHFWLTGVPQSSILYVVFCFCYCGKGRFCYLPTTRRMMVSKRLNDK